MGDDEGESEGESESVDDDDVGDIDCITAGSLHYA